MRKLLVSVLSVGLLPVPVALAFAAEEANKNDVLTEYPALMDAELLAEARGQVREAAKHAERKQEARRDRRAESGATEAGGSAGGSAGGASPALEAIAACESGGDPSAVSASGTYRGKYQFSQATWEAVGGSGDPAAAPEAEQDRRAAILYEQSGAGQWPVCGQ